MDMESVDSSESKDDEDYIPDQVRHDEESMVEDDDTGQIYDDNDDYNELTGNTSIDMNENNSVGPPTVTPGQGMADKSPGVEDNEIEGEEHDDHDFADSEVEDNENPGVVDHKTNENPGVVDHENEGVEQAGPDGHSIEADGENQDITSTEIDKDENMTADQERGDERQAQGKPQYNLRKNCA